MTFFKSAGNAPSFANLAALHLNDGPNLATTNLRTLDPRSQKPEAVLLLGASTHKVLILVAPQEGKEVRVIVEVFRPLLEPLAVGTCPVPIEERYEANHYSVDREMEIIVHCIRSLQLLHAPLVSVCAWMRVSTTTGIQEYD
jgi:hypothetical protein